MLIVFLLKVVFPTICISFFSPISTVWLNWLYCFFSRSDKKKISHQSIQQCKFGHFIILSPIVDHRVLGFFYFDCFFVFFLRKQKNFKYVKVNVLKNEMHNIIVLMASAVGWTLQEKKERKSLTIPHQMMLSPFYHSIHSFSHKHLLFPPTQCFPFWRAGTAVCSGLEHTRCWCASSSGVGGCMYLLLLSSAMIFLSCLKHL